MPAVYADLGAPLSAVLFATDAMGASEADNGGYGVVGRTESRDVMKQCYLSGTAPLRTVAQLDGDTSRLRRPERPLATAIRSPPALQHSTRSLTPDVRIGSCSTGC